MKGIVGANTKVRMCVTKEDSTELSALLPGAHRASGWTYSCVLCGARFTSHTIDQPTVYDEHFVDTYSATLAGLAADAAHKCFKSHIEQIVKDSLK